MSQGRLTTWAEVVRRYHCEFRATVQIKTPRLAKCV